MSEHQLKYLLLSAVLLGIVIKRNFNDFYIYQCRKINLGSIGDNYYIGSKRIKQIRESLDSKLKLEHSDKRVMENVEKFINNYTKDELLLLRKNIQNLIISDEKIKDEYSTGIYDLENNLIIANDFSFNHEMHHAASTLGIIDGVMISGFMQDKEINGKSQGIGMGLNEGYTEYLSIKQVKNDNIYYERVVSLIPLIELFFDSEIELRNHYFNADLESVITKFSPICSKKEAINLIKDIDMLNFYDVFRTWFDKSDIIELSIRLRLLEYYEKLSGNKNSKEIFLPGIMADNLTKAKKLII